jgi:hypothetical protein
MESNGSIFVEFDLVELLFEGGMLEEQTLSCYNVNDM